MAGDGCRLANTAEFEMKGRADPTAVETPVTMLFTFLSSSVKNIGVDSD